MNLNHCLMAGFLGKDPDLRYTPTGVAVCNFSLAATHTYYVQEEKREETCWIDCVIWGKQAETFNQYNFKGSNVLVIGRIKLESWDDRQSGQKRYKHVFSVDQFRFISSPANTGGHQQQEEQAPPPQQQQRQPQQQRSAVQQQQRPTARRETPLGEDPLFGMGSGQGLDPYPTTHLDDEEIPF